jgi:hypothetical protein
MATTILPKGETMQVRLLRSMHIRGEYIAAGTVINVDRQDGRQMIYHERAVPFVEQPAAAAVAEPVPAEPAEPARSEPVNSAAEPERSEPAPAAEPEPIPSDAPGVQTDLAPVAESADAVISAEPAKARRTRKPKADTVADAGIPVSPATQTENPGASV